MDGKRSRACPLHSYKLTWLPDTLWGGQSVTEDALVPQTPKAVDDAPTLVQHCSLHLVLVCVRAPVA